MANLKEIRIRIKSVKNTQQVTKAMKMVAAAKLRRAQDRMLQLRPYASKLQEIIGNVMAVVSPEDIPGELSKSREEVKNTLVILITSNRGLAGPFNTNVIKNTFQYLNDNMAEELANGEVSFICMGRKGFEYVKKRNYPMLLEEQNYDVFSDLSFDNVNTVINEVFEAFESAKVDKVYLAYNEFKNVMSQIRRMEVLLPLAIDDLSTAEESGDAGFTADYIFEPDREEILSELIPKALRTKVFQAVLESNAAEQGARMVAMDTATENAEELLKGLKIKYNKARQAAITKEILEISAGADALSN
ncbi:MAG: ATP synthase F1 subunit gamma [Bacteroidota bacterium]